MPASETASDESSELPSIASSASSPHSPSAYQTAWPWVLCVIGLDCSTLAYQPSIAFGAAGRLLTVLVVAATLIPSYASDR